MESHLKTYTITLTAKGPIFVGSGKEYNRKEYVVLSRKYLGIADMGKIYTLCREKKIQDKFEEFMLHDNTNTNLGKWLDLCKLKKDAANPSSDKNCIRHVIATGETTLSDKGRNPPIMACVKDAYGRPYIPGSSLKGVLRTVLATQKILTDSSLQEKFKHELPIELERTRGNRCLKEMARSMEADIFNKLSRTDERGKMLDPKDAVNDMLQGFIVGDSNPIDPKALVLAQKIDLRMDGTYVTYPLLRESLRPGTKIIFPLTIDEKIFPITGKDLLDAIEAFDASYNDNFLTKFEKAEHLQKSQIFVGTGGGFVSKTVVYPIMGQKDGVATTIKIFDRTGVPRRHRHDEDINLGVAPHMIKCSKYNKKYIQMGLCDVAIS